MSDTGSVAAFTQLADRSGRGTATLVVLAAATLAAFSGFFWAWDFWTLLVVQLLAAATFHALVPLGESRTLAAVADRGLDYGRIRLWGSLTFVAGSLGAGQVITGARLAGVPRRPGLRRSWFGPGLAGAVRPKRGPGPPRG